MIWDALYNKSFMLWYRKTVYCLHTPELCTLYINRCRNPYFPLYCMSLHDLYLTSIPFCPWSLSLLQRRQITPLAFSKRIKNFKNQSLKEISNYEIINLFLRKFMDDPHNLANRMFFEIKSKHIQVRIWFKMMTL